MKRVLLTCIIIISYTSFVFSEGQPIDTTGKISSKYVSITLDSAQIEHLQKNRYLVLTTEQRRKLHFLKLPKYIDILDPFHTICTCGQIYAMWYKVDKIAFVVDTTNLKNNIYEEDIELNLVYNNDSNFVYKHVNDLYIGANGKLYYDNKLIDPQDIPSIIKFLPQPKSKYDNKFLTVYLPPTSNNVNQKKIMAMRKKVREIVPLDFHLYWL